MLKPKNQRGNPVGISTSSSSCGSDGGTSCSSSDASDPTDSPGIGYDGMPSFNVTVSVQPKSPLRAASQPGVGARNSASTTTKRSGGRVSFGSRSLGSVSTVASQTSSLAESIGNFDAETFEAEAKKSVAGSGLLSGDMSAAFPESIQRAEEVLRHARETLARADGGQSTKVKAGAPVAASGEGGGEKLTTEELEGLSRSLKRALFVCPNHRELHAMRGEVHRRLQDFRTAVNSLRLAVRMDKSVLSVRQRLAEVLLSQGMVWLDGGDNGAALACFEEACTVDGANACAHFCKTVALVKLSRFGDALRAMEAVLGRRKGTADDYVLRAKIRWAMGMVGPGNADMEIARRLRSDHPEVVMFGRRCLGDAEGLFAKAKAFADAGDDNMAVKVLNQVAEVTPDDVKVLIVRAACKRRLKDFEGALRDYDECSFRHYRGVHVGRRALDQAANQLRSMRGGEADGLEGGQGGGAGGEAGGGKGAALTPATSATATDTHVAGAIVAGENARVVETPGSGKNHDEDDGNDDFAGGGDGYAAVANDRARKNARAADSEDRVATGDGPPGQVEGPASSASGGTTAGRSANVGNGVVAERSTASGRAAAQGASLAGVLPESTGNSTTGMPPPTATQVAAAAGKLEERSETQAVNERSAEAELRRKFRRAIPHAGGDPSYVLRRPHLHGVEHGDPGRQHQQEFRGQQQGQSQEQKLQQRVLLSTSYHSRGVSRRGEGGLPRDSVLDEGGFEGPQQEQNSGEQRRRWHEQPQHEGEGYLEPPYITRQRCLVLNDWGLSLFQIGEHEKAVSAIDLAIEGDRVYAMVTEGSMESNFFLNRGDCYRGGGAAEMAVRDYKRALEIEPGNWMVKTRLSLAHYLKGNRLFNDGDFPGAKSELDTAIAYNWKISAYYVSRGHAQFFGGWISDAHADYRRALELDPGSAEALRLCRQFDAKGKLVTASGRSNGDNNKNKNALPVAPSSEPMDRREIPTPSLPPPFHPPSASSSISSHSSSTSSMPPTWSLPPPSRPSRAPRSPPLTSPPSEPVASQKTRRAAPSADCSIADAASAKQCKGCGSMAGACRTSQPRTAVATATARTFTGGTIGGGTFDLEQKRARRVRRRERKLHLPMVDTRPPQEPKWRKEAVVWAKAGHDGVKRVFKERLGGVPARDERLWGMLRTCAKKSWSTATAPARVGGAATATGTVVPTTTSSARATSSPGDMSLSGSSLFSAKKPEDCGWPVGLRGVTC